jgi:ribose transport system substrate-binding protein
MNRKAMLNGAAGALMASVAAVPMIAGQARAQAEGPFVIGLSESIGGTAWREIGIATLLALAEKPGYAEFIEDIVVVRTQGNDAASQMRDMRNLIAQGVDIILYNPASPTALEPVIQQAHARGIPVMAVNQPVQSEFAYTVATDTDLAGRIGGAWLAERLDAGDAYAVIEGIPGAPANDNTITLAREIIEEAGAEMVASAVSNWDEAQAQKAMADVLQSNPDIAGVYAPFVGGIGFPAAMEAAGTFVPFVGGTGFNGEACNLIEYSQEHGMEALLTPGHQSIYAKGLEQALLLLRGEEIERTQLYPPLELDTSNPASYEDLCREDLPAVLGLSYQWPGPVSDPSRFGEELPLTLEDVLEHYEG